MFKVLISVLSGLLIVHTFAGVGSGHTFAQQALASANETKRGIGLYQKGDLEGAIKVLRIAVKENKADADAWYHLGLALYRTNKTKDARRSFETAVKLRPNDVSARTGLAYTQLLADEVFKAGREAQRVLALDPQNAEALYINGVVQLRTGLLAEALESAQEASRVKPDFAQALLLKSQVLINMYSFEAPLNKDEALKSDPSDKGFPQLKEAAECLEKYLQLKPDAANANEWREQLDTLRIYAELADKNATAVDGRIFKSRDLREDPTSTKVRIRSKPSPAYTREAESAGVSGTVILQMVFASDGRVRHILVLRWLSHGLTAQAVKAARQIKFDPATSGGRPVSIYLRVEYNFDIY